MPNADMIGGDILLPQGYSPCLRAASLLSRRSAHHCMTRRIRWRCTPTATASESVPVIVGRDGSLLFRFYDDSSALGSHGAEAQLDHSRATSADVSDASSEDSSNIPADQQHEDSHANLPKGLKTYTGSDSTLPLSIRDAQALREAMSKRTDASDAVSEQVQMLTSHSRSVQPAAAFESRLRHGEDVSVATSPSDPGDSEAVAGGRDEQSQQQEPPPPPPLPTSQQQFYERQRLQADQRQQQRLRGLDPVSNEEADGSSAEGPSESDDTQADGATHMASRYADTTASHAAAVAAVRSLQNRAAVHGSLTGASRARETQASHDAAQVAAGQALLQSRGLSASVSDDISLLEAFSDLSETGHLQQALSVVAAYKVADRRDVMPRLLQRHFLKMAVRRRDVNAAIQFVQLLPQSVTDVRTYTMLISVCAAAGDAVAALRAADSWREMGRKLDTKMYTNVITACAEAADADAATLEYQRMRAEGCVVDRHVFSALISAFNAAVRQRRGAVERRADLVLLERAFNLVDDMREADLEPDVVTYNTLVSLAGQVGQLQRAKDTVTEMEMRRCQPDEYTFASLIDACSRSGQPEAAREVYEKAIGRNVAEGPVLYSAAIAACQAGAHSDAAHAMQIYRDMLRNGVQPDARLYSSLMSVAGAAGDTALAFSLLDDMTDEGVRQCTDTLSSLVLVCVFNDQVDRALEVYKTMRSRRVVPSAKAFNALVGATGSNGRLAAVADILSDMAAVGYTPDTFTYSAVLTSCQRAQEADLAFDIYSLMQSQGIRIGISHAFSLLRVCFNAIRSMWFPAGYPPSSDALPTLPASRRSREGAAVLAALGGTPSSPADSPSDAAGWQARALKVYKEALQSGPPSLRLLDRLLGCLREPLPPRATARDDDTWRSGTSSTSSSSRRLPRNRRSSPKAAAFPPDEGAASSPLGSAWQVRARYGGDRQGVATTDTQSDGVWGRMQDKAIAVVEEAVSLRVLPGYNLSDSLTVDFRYLPPNVAESYALAILNSLYRRKRPRRWERVEHAIAFLVPPFDSHNILHPSEPHSRAANQAHVFQGSQTRQQLSQEGQQGTLPGEDTPSGPPTALGVAAAVKRLKVHAAMDSENGAIMMQPQELTRWVRATARAEANLRGAPGQGIWEGVRMRSTPIARQAANIRMQGKGGSGRQSQPSWQSVLQRGNTGFSGSKRSDSAVDNWWNETEGGQSDSTDSYHHYYGNRDDNRSVNDTETDGRGTHDGI